MPNIPDGVKETPSQIVWNSGVLIIEILLPTSNVGHWIWYSHCTIVRIPKGSRKVQTRIDESYMDCKYDFAIHRIRTI